MAQSNGKVGRPKTGRKDYGSVRLERPTASKINTLKLVLRAKKQDDVVNKALNILIDGLSDKQRKLYDTLLPLLSDSNSDSDNEEQ